MRCTFCRVTPSRRAICGTVMGEPEAALKTCQRAWVWPAARAIASPERRNAPASSKISAMMNGTAALCPALFIMEIHCHIDNILSRWRAAAFMRAAPAPAINLSSTAVITPQPE